MGKTRVLTLFVNVQISKQSQNGQRKEGKKEIRGWG